MAQTYIDADASEEQQALARQFEIHSIPTLMVIRDGVLLFAQPGMLPEGALTELVKKVREIDMEPLKRQVDKEKARVQASAN